MRKLRVVTEEYRKRKYREAIEEAKNKIKKMTRNFYNDYVIMKKLERLEGNDIVRMLSKIINDYNSLSNGDPIKKILTSGRIGKKIGASDVRIFVENERMFPSLQGEIGTINSIPVVNDSNFFERKIRENRKTINTQNPTGMDEWMSEIEILTKKELEEEIRRKMKDVENSCYSAGWDDGHYKGDSDYKELEGDLKKLLEEE